MRDLIGRTLGHYRIVEKIGEGGMGEVYRAHDERLDRDVALKILPARFAGDPDRLTRFEREARAVAALNHPNIVTLHTIEEADGHRFITIEHIRGQTLAALIPQDGMAVDRILEIAIPLAGALAAAHEKGVIHRDLKPNNVMVDEDGRVKILDFGVAKLRREPPPGEASEASTETITGDGHVVGTLPYMPPEQLRGERLDARADLYSFGVMLYEMTTGERPFAGETSPDLASAILKDPPRPLDTFRPDLPFRLGTLIERCLEKQPKRRIQSALDLQRDLEDFKEELSTSNRRTSTARQPEETSVTFSQSRRRLLAGIAFVGVAVIAALMILIFQQLGTPPKTEAPTIQSLAVLPFANLMNDPEQDYFVDGMHEALLTDLAKMKSVRVISRSSVMRYKEAPEPIKGIARDLDVDAVIEGSVLRSGNQVRITAQLIDGATDEHLWAESYDRDLEDVLSLLSDVSKAIASEIQTTIVSRDEKGDVPSPRINPEAYETYLRGRHAFGTFSGEGQARALDLYQRAIELDPAFAPAWASLATAQILRALFISPGKEGISTARASARRALKLDPNVGEAHAVLGFISLYSDWDWPAAERELKRALMISPNDASVRHAYADYLLVTGKPEESLEQVRLGRSYDPLSRLSNQIVLYHAFMAGHFEEVIIEIQRMNERFPGFQGTHNMMGNALWSLGRYDEALAEYEMSWGPESFQIFSQGFDRLGPKGAMKAMADRLVEQSKTQPVGPLDVAVCAAAAGENDLAFEWLEKAFDARSAQLLHAPFHPRFDSIRADPRFEALMQRIGIPGAVE